MNYDVIIVGAGPGGIFSAYELVNGNKDLKIAVFELGNPLEKRKCPIDGKKVKSCIKCPICAIMSGFGGAGAFSDGKYNITNQFGGTLYEYIGKTQAIELMRYVDKINLKYGGEGTKLYSTANTAIKKKCFENDLHLLDAQVRHLGTDINYVVLENIYNELKDKIRELEEERKSLKASKTKILNETRAKQKELLEDKQEELDELIKQVKKKAKKNYDEDAKAELDKIRRRLRAGVKDLSSDDEDDAAGNVSLPGEPPKKIEKGQKYFAPGLNIVGTALDSSDNGRTKIRIQNGIMTYTVPANELRTPTNEQLTKPEEPEDTLFAKYKGAKAGSTSSLKVQKAQTVVSELMLIGKRAAEAESELEKYIDDCHLAGLKTVRIVHGKGTGALRSAVEGKLAADPRVKEFRLGDPAEGGDGVTIAKLV